MYDTISKIIKESALFDEKYYISKYEDIKRRNNDPLRHFIRHGFKEGRNPNAFFDTKLYIERYLKGDKKTNPLYHYLTSTSSFSNKTSDYFDGAFYLKKYPDVLKSGMNPLSHYILHGINEGRQAVNTTVIPNKNASNFLNIIDIKKINLTIIIPVYNAIDEVIDCLDSVVRNTPLSENINVLVLNDCSPDKSVKPSLNKYKNHEHINIKHHFRNLGYTKNVNKGIQLSKNRDVILLNSDTIVSPNWIRNLITAAYSQEDIGTVTAVSNGAGAFSVPKSGYNEVPNHLDIDSLSRIVNQCNGPYIDVPTGNGFCLYIKRSLINDIGIFDEKKFPKGYGEENDFCMRAVECGWLNIVDTKTYIYHKRSASFKESKHKLMESGVNQVKSDFPEYAGAIKSIGGSELFKDIRSKIDNKINKINYSTPTAKPKLMFVISTRTGGTPQTNLDLMRQLSEIYDCYALASNAKVVEILKAGSDGYEVIEQHLLSQPVKYATHRSFEYENLVRSLLFKYNIDLLHIRHLAWHSLRLPKIAKSLLIPVVNSFHDFYTICPSVNLIDGAGTYHPNGVSLESPNPLWKDETVKPMNESMLIRWQDKMSKSLSICDHFITTCDSAKQILLKKLNIINSNNEFTVIPHGRDFKNFIKPVDFNIIETPLKVLVPGNISLSKGSELIKQVKTLDIHNQIEFHVLGTCDDDLKPFVIYHGRYQREDFQKIVAKIQPHISAVFSIWPETYCHTLTESWATGIPVLGIAYGAVEERINQHKAGWLISNDFNECYTFLINLIGNPQDLLEKQQAVVKWQNGFGKENTVSNMTGKYISIYQSILKPVSKPVKGKLGFIMKGYFPEVPPTAYVRLVDWKDEFEKETDLEVKFAPWSDILTRNLIQYEKFVIQRDSIPAYAVDWCINTLKRHNIPYIFEIDDNLLEVPTSVDPGGIYKKYKPYLEKLLVNAEYIHVTNNELLNICLKYNKNITIRPNKIFPHRWKKCLEDEFIDLNLIDSDLNILYFGSKTHQEDLDFLIDSISISRKSGKNIQLYVIGCGDNLPEIDYIHRLTPPSSRYDLFTAWLVKISHQFNIGVAPLVDRNFAKHKSYLKAIELVELNLKVICSNVLPYIELKGKNDKKITFVDNSADEWAQKILLELDNL